MSNSIFPKGILKIKVDGGEYLVQYVGRQNGFECCVCGRGENCYTFNIFESVESYRAGQWETWGFGRSHLNHVTLLEVVDADFVG